MTKEDKIDYGVGIELNKKIGDLVFENEELLKIYHHGGNVTLEEVTSCFKIIETPVETPKIILDVIE